MSFLNFLKPKKINDELVGKDEKVCSCSVRIAELLQKSTEAKSGEGKNSLRQTLAQLQTQNNHSDKCPK